ncbi:peptidase T [Striga asiatica]|uniref:Peptidase T n=1 Tax=Striga asiatica TaxID=4170 RepID=A0A5A7R8C6_STRAF|nr:peptidase T [Striga asiatica]
MIAYNSILVSLAVHLIGADVDEAADLAGDLAGLEKHVGPVDVVFGELEAVAERVVDMGLSGEVHDGIDAFGDEEIVDEVGTSDIALDKLEVRAVIELVEDHDFVVRMVPDETVGHMGGNESGSSCNEDVLGRECIRHFVPIF